MTEAFKCCNFQVSLIFYGSFCLYFDVGFPRTLPQAEALYKSQPVDVVVDLNVPFNVIIERIEGRWTHAPSGRIYHNIFHPPKVQVTHM